MSADLLHRYADIGQDYLNLARNTLDQVAEMQSVIDLQADCIRSQNRAGLLEEAALETRRLEADKMILEALKEKQAVFAKLTDAYIFRAGVEE